MKVLFVCLGNICRSPTAEIVCREMAVRKGLAIEVDSAGTAAYHAGELADSRSVQAAAQRGYDMSQLRARQVMVEDFYDFDFIFAMDSVNFSELTNLQPVDGSAHLSLFLRDYGRLSVCDVPDPYYGGERGFEWVLDLLEDATQNFLKAQVS